jgi:very-short-patch-repair endonuclease
MIGWLTRWDETVFALHHFVVRRGEFLDRGGHRTNGCHRKPFMRRAQPWLTNRARVLRANDTSAEDRVWQALRSRQLGGLKFVRQLPIGQYFADFACRERKVIFEIDGATHSSDAVRSAFLAEKGFRIFRAHNSEIYGNLDGVLDTLLAFTEATDTSGDMELAAAPHPNPLPVAKGNGERE